MIHYFSNTSPSRVKVITNKMTTKNTPLPNLIIIIIIIIIITTKTTTTTTINTEKTLILITNTND